MECWSNRVLKVMSENRLVRSKMNLKKIAFAVITVIIGLSFQFTFILPVALTVILEFGKINVSEGK